jgi:hypothetical protein
MLEGLKLAQAESAARFALRHNGQEPADRLLGATRALAAAITALVAERAEHDKLKRAMSELFDDAVTMSISPQPVTLSACSAESNATTSAASSGSSAGASGDSERRHCACPELPQRRPQPVQCVQERRLLQQQPQRWPTLRSRTAPLWTRKSGARARP